MFFSIYHRAPVSSHLHSGRMTTTTITDIDNIRSIAKQYRHQRRTDQRRVKAFDDQKIRWAKWQRDQIELKAEEEQFRAYWRRRKMDDENLWRDKDFANAVDKMSRSGYKGKHGSFTVPADDLSRMLGLYLQVTVGDAPTTKPSVNETAYTSWISVKGCSREDAQRQFIVEANKLLTNYGWNPPPGWR